MIKNENYITIQGWMLNELNLKGNELLIYAIIYGFSQDNINWFEGSLQYLADWTNSTKQGVLKCLKQLIEKEYIEKEENFINKVKYCKYRNLIQLNKVEQGIKQSLMGYQTKFNGVLNKVEQGIKQSLINNIEYNIDNINNKNINNNINIQSINQTTSNDTGRIKTNDLQFEEFYKKYPNKKAKQKALLSFNKALKTTTFEKIMQGLDNYIKDIETKKTEKKYIKHPATWLNQGCWDDEYETNITDKSKLFEIMNETMGE